MRSTFLFQLVESGDREEVQREIKNNGFVFRSEIKNRLALMASFQMCKLPIPCTPFKPSTDNEPHDPSSLWARGHGVHVSKENKNLFDYSEQFSTLPESI